MYYPKEQIEKMLEEPFTPIIEERGFGKLRARIQAMAERYEREAENENAKFEELILASTLEIVSEDIKQTFRELAHGHREASMIKKLVAYELKSILEDC